MANPFATLAAFKLPGVNVTPGQLGSVPTFGYTGGVGGLSGFNFNLGGAQNPNGSAGAPGGGGNPAAGILADYLSKMRADANAASVFDAATRDAAIKRLAISYGQVPDFSALGIDKNTSDILKHALDQKTIDLANQNTQQGTSAYARMLHANEVANRQIPALLAGRGLLRSGQTTYNLTEQAQNYKNQQFDALNEMLNQATQAIGAYAAAERQRQEELAQAELQAALAAAAQGYGAGGGGGGGGGGGAGSADTSYLYGQPINLAGLNPLAIGPNRLPLSRALPVRGIGGGRY